MDNRYINQAKNENNISIVNRLCMMVLTEVVVLVAVPLPGLGSPVVVVVVKVEHDSHLLELVFQEYVLALC
jgi:hypothetical protein